MWLVGDGFEIRPVGEAAIGALLEVYRQCEDFLALGPEPRASREMVVKDLQLSKDEGGVFCGIFDADGSMVGLVDFVPSGFDGDTGQAFISLLMIARAHRGRGLGAEVVQLVEDEITRGGQIHNLYAGVQVNNPAALRFWRRQGYRIVAGPDLQPDGTTTYLLCKDVGEAGKEP